MAIKSFGASFSAATNAVGGLTEISNGGAEAAIIDVTNHDSDDNCREFLGGLVDGGEITLSGQYLYSDTGQAYLRGAVFTGTPFAFVLNFSSGSKITGNCIVRSVGGENSTVGDEVVPFTCTLKITGKPVYGALA